MNTIPVVEIFGPTIQGEGPNIGARCIFVRVKGCDYSCKWCDSAFTWAQNNSDCINYDTRVLAYKISNFASKGTCYRVVLTGGNPCLYDFSEVLQQLAGHIKFDVETQGSIIPEWLSYIDTVVFSPKPPSSGMEDTYKQITKYIEEEKPSAQNIAIKIPVFDIGDIEFARHYAEYVNCHNQLKDDQIRLYLSVGNSDVNTTESIRDKVLSDYKNLLNTINVVPMEFENVFILPQLHTLVWGNKQGV